MASQSGYHDAGSSGFGISSSKLGPRDLPSKRLLGTGVASVGYETELNGKKCLRKDFMGVPSGTFRREAARLVRLEDHFNVVKTLDWTENKMSCSLVLEYMDDDLLGFLQKRKQSQGNLAADPSSGNQSDLDSRKLAPFELPVALDIMLQIARGMEFLSDKGIRHGNLKTKNILVTRMNDRDRNSLSVKVADFGLVRTRRKSTSFASRQARKLDMARWTAPELLEVSLLEDKGETSSESDSDEDCTDLSDLEWRELGTDVYSFAVTCSQILTGEDPYPNLNWKQLGVNIVRHGLTPTLPAACPPELRWLLVSCWDFDHSLPRLCERPSFSYIRETLEDLQKMNLPAQDLHESSPLLVKAPTNSKGKALLDTKRKDQLRKPMPGKEPADVVRDIGVREPITVEDLWGPNIDPVEDLWRREFLPPPRFVSGLRTGISFSELLSAVARLITRTRTVVRRRTEWTQLREELELLVPGMLRIRNRCFSFGGAGSDAWEITVDPWFEQLSHVISDTSIEVVKDEQQEDDRFLLPSLSAAVTEPWTMSKLRNDINLLAKLQKMTMLDLALSLKWRQARGVLK